MFKVTKKIKQMLQEQTTLVTLKSHDQSCTPTKPMKSKK